jgi:hypothetical protein
MKTQTLLSQLLQWLLALALLFIFIGLVLTATLTTASLLHLNIESTVELATALVAPIILLLPVWMLLGLFFLTPLFRLSGVLKYYSPYLIVSRTKPDHLALHGATPFDYLRLFSWKDRGRPAVRRILLWYIEGLLALAREVSKGNISKDTTITGTSYIFSAGNAKRFGFTVEDSGSFAWGGYLTYLTQFLTYSFAQGRWALPPVHLAKRASIKAERLCAKLDFLEQKQKQLRRSLKRD